MDFPVRAAARSLFATAAAVLLAAACAGVSAAQDQDGAAPSRGAYQGPMLSWAGKTPQRVDQPVAPQPPVISDAPPPRYVAPSPPRSPPPRYIAPPPAAPENASEPEPESAPPPAPRIARVDPGPAPRAPVAEAAAPPTPAAATPAPAAAATPDPGHTGPRFYSLHREYGLTPDPIPVPAQRSTVLVGPPDRGADPGQDAAGADDNPDKPAPHGDDQGADGAGDPSGQN
jgi:hypothetical protein